MTNRIPLSLERPFLRDAIVEFRFSPRVSPELLPGIFYERLREEWATPYSVKGSSTTLGYQLTASVRQLPYFVKDGYRLHVLGESVYFNITESYPGWSNSYLPLIKDAALKIFDKNTVKLHRVSLRFVNDLPDVDVFDLTNSFSHPSLPNFTRQGQSVRYTIKKKETNVVLNFASNVSSPNKKSEISVIDIDLQRDLSEQEQNVDSAIQLVQMLHDMNKEILFGELIPESFLANFGVKYP